MRRGSTAVLTGLALLVAVTCAGAFHAADIIELPLRDVALRLLPTRAAARTTVVAIDERALREIGPWPWPRAVIARLVDGIGAAGARAAVLDILLAEPRPGDAQLAAAMHRVPTAAVCVLIEGQRWIVPAPAIAEAATVAHGNFELDRDGILRRFASTKQSDDRAYTALSLEAASFVRDVHVPVGRSIALAFRTPPRTIPIVSATDVLRGNARTLRNRIVFVGPTALGLGDRVLTPVSSASLPDPGVTVHAASTESLLRGEAIRELPPIAAGAIAGLAVSAILRLRTRPRRMRLALACSLLALVLLGGEALLATAGVALPFLTFTLAIALTAAGVEATVMSSSLQKSQVDVRRLEVIATDIAAHRAQEIESKRVLAHELRTPLASMRNLTQLLAGYELSDAERQRVTSLLQTEAGKLESMVDALLDLERLVLRDFRSSSARTDLGDLARARVAFLAAGTRRTLDVSAPSGVLVRADAMLIERVIDNLVANALKYTPAAAPVRVAVRHTDGEAMLEVEDRGPGIAEPERERIFRRFVRGSTARGTEGLGLGLSLVAEVARWHGGRVSLEAVPAGGSLFRVTLPRDAKGDAAGEER
jgi:signal transduction histidine kinase